METIKFENGQEPEILSRVEQLGFKTFKGSANYDLNIIGVRNPSPMPDQFDDLLFVCYKNHGVWFQHKFKCTTDPSLYYLRKPLNVKGTAIMVSPQQCRSVYQLDLHQGKYKALCQRNGSVKVWRDSNRNSILDRSGEEFEGAGINIHRASAYSVVDSIGRYSAGCTVIQDPEDFAEFISLCEKQVDLNGWKNFTYTLINGQAGDFHA